MKENNKLTLIRAALIAGLALVMSIVAINNIADPGTNTYLLSNMFSMDLLKHAPAMGMGLWSRAMTWSWLPTFTLILVIAYEVYISILLWRVLIKYIICLRNYSKTAEFNALKCANFALSCQLAIYLFFMAGGMFFGYWMKMSQIQAVHVHMITLTLIAFILVNFGVDSPETAT